MGRILCFLLIVFQAFNLKSQTLNVDGEVSHWEADVLVGLHNDGYEFDFGASYFPVQYVGLKANIGFSGEIEELGDWGRDELETGHHYAVRFKFNPAIVLRTPRLINWKNQDAGLYLFAEPGFILSPGARGSEDAKIFRWDFKGGANLQFDRFIVFAGYGISNFSLYSGYPDNRNGLPVRDNYITHFGFIGTAYKF